MANLWAVILAGGYGTRFWPLSRMKRPKQFLPIVSEKPMVQETIERILPLVSPERIIAIAPKDLISVLKKETSKYKGIKIIEEPSGKNTAPSIILACTFISKLDDDPTVIVLPSDHFIGNKEEFLRAVNASFHLSRDVESLFTFGIKPSSPETGFGYIQINREKLRSYEGEKFFEVLRFVEKPTRQTAEEYLRSGDYFWNSGMFLWRISVFKESLKRYAPEYYEIYEELEKVSLNQKSKVLEIWDKIKPLSIDYALMERASSILMVRADFDWSDVGSWNSLYQIWGTDSEENSFKGEVYAIDSSGCLVFSGDKIVSLIGLKDIIVINTEDALLVCHRDHVQKVREIVDALKKKGKMIYL